MNQVKESIHYFCSDVVNRRVLGQGVGVAVLDTGIVIHPDFDRRVLGFQDMIGDKACVYDDNGHGTHVAGIIGGSGRLSKGLYAGIAPKCNLIGIKVLDYKGNGTIFHVLKAIRWIVENRKRYNIRVVNISVGTLPQVGDYQEERLLEAVEMLWDLGIVVVAAAGNYGPKAGTITTPGISKKVITVGASDDQSYTDKKGHMKNNYSGRGPTSDCVCKPDVVAPGSYITSCDAKYSNSKRMGYMMKSGTSMSTPIVSGAIALLISKYPDISNVEVKLNLRRASRDMGLPQNQQGWGLLDIERLLNSIND